MTGALYQARCIHKVLIVAPLSIVGVWEEEFEKFADFPYELIVLKGTLAKKSEGIAKATGQKLQIIVVNYESAWRLEKVILSW